MLPSKGYFQDIECPYYEIGCNRPYCHFLHRRKPCEDVHVKAPDPPTYKPTPKSELANIRSHIPISYVPDLAPVTRPITKFNFERPVYKPTPLSLLSAKQATETTIEDVEACVDSDIDFEDLSAEIDLIDEIVQPEHEEPIESDQTNISKVEKSTRKSSKKHEKSKSETKDRKSDSKHSHSSSRDKSKHYKSDRHKSKTKDKADDKRSKDKDRHKTKERDKERKKDDHKRSGSSKKKEKEDKTRIEEPQMKEEDKLKYHLDDSDLDFDNDLEEDTLMECLQIFQEYKPEMPQISNDFKETISQNTEQMEETKSSNRKRIAHATKPENDYIPKTQPIKKPQPNAALTMTNRFKAARCAQASNEQSTLAQEMKQTIKRPAPTLLEAARNMKQQKLTTIKRVKTPGTSTTPNLVDSILQGSKQPIKIRKIAPVQNVTSIQRAKAKIDELSKQKVETLFKTPAQNVKGAKRVAHIPDFSLSDLPDVLHSDKSKLPVNVRTRFLTMIADECVKLYLIKSDAYTRALNEENSCYEKCKVLNTYKNSAMLCVSRLRKELQERENLGLGPIGENEQSHKNKPSEMQGRRFYENIQKYVLTEEELDIHGYPKESTIPGHAVITNRKNSSNKLRENQRKCARCRKIYVVDVDGFPMYTEQCVYHPLKKRTLRGEQTYLCCKSNDDTGCATSTTHVCDLPEEAELEGYQTTMQPEHDEDPRSHAVYALDCEMCYTTRGLELTRVTVIDPDCKTVYESLVKPLNPIIDYNTNFSGITKEQMDRTSTSILQVQANILHLCNSKTILIGHSLESDMKALKIIHGTVVDTSVMFPHKMGLPHKRALRMLASEYLKKIIQNNLNGHDSAEDAVACMDLVKWKIKEEMKVRGIK